MALESVCDLSCISARFDLETSNEATAITIGHETCHAICFAAKLSKTKLPVIYTDLVQTVKKQTIIDVDMSLSNTEHLIINALYAINEARQFLIICS